MDDEHYLLQPLLKHTPTSKSAGYLLEGPLTGSLRPDDDVEWEVVIVGGVVSVSQVAQVHALLAMEGLIVPCHSRTPTGRPP